MKRLFVTLLFCFLWNKDKLVYCQETYIVGSTPQVYVSVENVNPESSFMWLVDGSEVATINVTDGNLTSITTTINRYDVEASIDSGTLNSSLSFDILMSTQNSINIKFSNGSLLVNETLMIVASCGDPPAGLMGCQNYMCKANSESGNSRSPQFSESEILYSCRNTSTCEFNGQWSNVQLVCNTSSQTGCASPSRWGSNCMNDCSPYCVSNECNFKNGSCICIQNYAGNPCSLQLLPPCEVGKWGENCTFDCGEGCLDRSCQKETGVCTNSSSGAILTDCKPGFKGDKCNMVGCQTLGTWGPNCTKTCGFGCPEFGICDFETGHCSSNGKCLAGYTLPTCSKPICDQDCNGGECLAPNSCQLCPLHFESGRTCRNVSLDGFLRGSLTTFAILTGVVIFLSVSSEWYVKKRVQKKAH